MDVKRIAKKRTKKIHKINIGLDVNVIYLPVLDLLADLA